jgi:solute carrier family 25 iron transporter 28/37
MQVFTTQPAAVYTGMTQAFTRVISTEGASRLWRGVWSVILGAGPAHAVYFGTYEAVKDFAGGNRAGHHLGATGENSLLLLLGRRSDVN